MSQDDVFIDKLVFPCSMILLHTPVVGFESYQHFNFACFLTKDFISNLFPHFLVSKTWCVWLGTSYNMLCEKGAIGFGNFVFNLQHSLCHNNCNGVRNSTNCKQGKSAFQVLLQAVLNGLQKYCSNHSQFPNINFPTSAVGFLCFAIIRS